MTTVADISARTGLSGTFVETLDEFTGQERAKGQLRVLIGAAKRKGKRLPHLVIASGYQGVGKTNLSMICAAEMDAEMVILDPLCKPGDALQRIEVLPARSIVYMDEVHRGKGKLDWMLQPVENGVITTGLGVQPLPDVTWIISTTDPGVLPQAFLDRFTAITIDRYTDDEADEISMAIAVKLRDGKQPMPHARDAMAIARAANNNPRIMRRLWEAVYDYYWSDPERNFDGGRYLFAEVLDWWGLTEDGLTDQAVRYLTIMYDSFPDGAGAKAIADALHEPSGVRYTEQLLHDKGLIAFTKQGRMLTSEGRRRALALKPSRMKVA